MPVILSQEQSRRVQRAAMLPIVVGMTGLVLTLCWCACAELPLIGPGPRTWIGGAILAFVHFAWLHERFGALPDRPERPMCEGAVSVVLLPVALFGGRVAFSIFPPWDDWMGGGIGLVLGAFALSFLIATENFDRFVYHRGTKLFTQEAFAALARLIGEEDRVANDTTTPPDVVPLTVEWAGERMPLRTLGHSLTIGAPGSGKTLQHRAVLRSLVSQLRPEHDTRVVLYDVKLDALSELYAMRPQVPVYVLNPLDARGAAWSIAQDFNNPNHAMDLAKCIAPDKSEATGDRDNVFFRTAAQMVLAATLEALMRRAPGDWTLRDVVNLTADRRHLKKVLEGVEQTAAVVNTRFSPRRTFNDVLQTLNNSTSALKVVAAAYEANPMKVSLRQVFDSGSAIIVLGSNLNFRASTEAVNRAMFRFMAFEALGGPESLDRPRLTFHCDELAEARYLSGLSSLMSDGRSKGVTAFLGTQNNEGMRDAFGADEAMTILNQCANVSVLRQASPETADWASKRIGEVERFEYLRGDLTQTTRDQSRPGQKIGEALVSRPAVMPSELLGLPTVRNGNVTGVHVLAALGGVMRGTVTYPLHTRNTSVDYQPRADLAQLELAPWNDADERRLVEPDAVPAAPTPTTRPQSPDAATGDRRRMREGWGWLDQLERIEF